MPWFGALLALAFVGAAHATRIGAVIDLPVCGGVCYYDSESLAVLPTGAFAVVRRVNSAVIEAVFFDPSGRLLRGPVTLTSASESDVYGSIRALGGHYIATWSTLHEGTAYSRIFDESGQAVDRRKRFPFSATLDPGRLFFFGHGANAVGALFLVHVAINDQFDNPFPEVGLQRVAAGGRLLGDEELLSERNRRFLPETATVDSRGDIFTAGSSCPRSPLSTKPCVRAAKLWRHQWTSARELPVAALPGLEVRHLSAGSRPEGRLALAWVERHAPDFGYRDELRMRQLGPGGGGNATRSVTGVLDRGIAFPTVRSAAGGGWVVAWLEIEPVPFPPISVWIATVGTTINPELVASGIHAYGFAFEVSDTGRGAVLFDSSVAIVDVSSQDDSQ